MEKEKARGGPVSSQGPNKREERQRDSSTQITGVAHVAVLKPGEKKGDWTSAVQGDGKTQSQGKVKRSQVGKARLCIYLTLVILLHYLLLLLAHGKWLDPVVDLFLRSKADHHRREREEKIRNGTTGERRCGERGLRLRFCMDDEALKRARLRLVATITPISPPLTPVSPHQKGVPEVNLYPCTRVPEDVTKAKLWVHVPHCLHE